ncbi:hypothetical protein B0H13DRAFT_1908455 [Mycena leptocephala]|nr:hypothetical protein B0H13DRAFT_1908455 [Mycena leptocephala]
MCAVRPLNPPPPPNCHRRRLPTYEAQFDALLASRRRRLYKLEGRGKIYVTTCVSNADVDKYRDGTLTGDDLLAKLQFKIGHTSSLKRRCRQYRKCEKGQTHIWLWTYDAAQRYLAERLIHLRLFGGDVHAVPQNCPGCGVKHREFFCPASVGGLRGLDRIVTDVLGLLGQKSVKQHLGSTALEANCVPTASIHNFLDLAGVSVHFLSNADIFYVPNNASV